MLARDSTRDRRAPDSDTALQPALLGTPSSGRMDRYAWIGPTMVGVGFVALLMVGLFAGTGVLTTLTVAMFYIAVAQGWNILGGMGGYLNLGIAVFTGTGAYVAAALNTYWEWGFLATILPAAVLTGILSVFFAFGALRLRSYYFALFTLVLGFLVIVLVRNTPILGGAHGLFTTLSDDLSLREATAFVFLTLLAIAALSSLIAFLVQRSRFGSALRGIREDEPAAALLGVRTSRTKVYALLISAVFAGAAGACYAFFLGYIEPAGTFDLGLSLDIVLVCVIGGLGSWYGPLIGGMIVVLLQQWLRTSLPTWSIFGWEPPAEASRLLFGVLLIIFALFVRAGIVGLFTARTRSSEPKL